MSGQIVGHERRRAQLRCASVQPHRLRCRIASATQGRQPRRQQPGKHVAAAGGRQPWRCRQAAIRTAPSGAAITVSATLEDDGGAGSRRQRPRFSGDLGAAVGAEQSALNSPACGVRIARRRSRIEIAPDPPGRAAPARRRRSPARAPTAKRRHRASPVAVSSSRPSRWPDQPPHRSARPVSRPSSRRSVGHQSADDRVR